VLGDFAFLDLFSERSTVAGSVTTGAADFLCAFGHGARTTMVVMMMVTVVVVS
jgi:hypothetical protein